MNFPPRLSDGGVALLLGREAAPGSDEHKVKGVAYRGHLEFIEEQMEGGIAAHLNAIEALPLGRSLELREFMSQTFLASSLYDVFPLAIVGVACARATGEDYISFVSRRTQMQVAKDIRGVHKFLMKIVSAKMVASRLPRLLTQYMNFTSVEVDRPTDDQVRAIIGGIPLPLGGWFTAVLDTYMRGVLEIAGAESARVETTCVIDDDQQTTHLDMSVLFG